MKLVATILCFYLMGLFLQPSLLPQRVMKEKMRCCCPNDKNGNKDCNKGEKQNDCCNNGLCNPLLANCQLSITLGMVSSPVIIPPSAPDSYQKATFLQSDEQLNSHYFSKLLRPPETV